MSNDQVSQILDQMAALLEMRGAETFKVAAYHRAARTIAHLPRDVGEIAQEDGLEDIPGIGKSIAAKIREYLQTGRVREHQELVSEFPDGALRLLDVPGIGPKTALRICRELGISTVEGLEKAVIEGRLQKLPRMGEKSAQNILRQIRSYRTKSNRIPLGKALPVAEAICEVMRPYVRNVTPAGSLRRLEETIGDIDIMGTSHEPVRALEAFTRLPMVTQVLGRGETKASVVIHGELQVDFRIVPHESFGTLVQYFTGNKDHNILLRDRALGMGLKLSEYGITDLATGRMETFLEEEPVYARLGLPFIPPELRWGQDEILLAEQGRLPRLVELGDLRGDLHCHTDWSDGRDSLDAMVEGARSMGYGYVAITDHSVGCGIANGLSPERLQEEIDIIRRINREARNGLRVLTGSEVDIRGDGSLDFSDEVLETLDVVVASIHSAMGQEKTRMTARIIRAMENPHVDIIGHLTARLIGERPPVEMDVEEVLQAALRTGTAIEINASPMRLDLRDVFVRRARELGVKLVIDSDSHAAGQMPGLRFGVGVARRGMCEAGDILNTRSLDEFLAGLKGEAPALRLKR